MKQSPQEIGYQVLVERARAKLRRKRNPEEKKSACLVVLWAGAGIRRTLPEILADLKIDKDKMVLLATATHEGRDKKSRVQHWQKLLKEWDNQSVVEHRE